MPRRIGELTETGIVAEMRAEIRRLRRGAATIQSPLGEYDEYTLASSTDSAHTLTYIPSPSLIPIACLNGLPGRYGTDYTVSFTTGVVTWSATKVAGDILSVFYQTTGDLIALSGPGDTGSFVLNALGFDWQPTSVLYGTQAGGYPPLASTQGPGVTFAGLNNGSTNYTGDWSLYSREIATGVVALYSSGGPFTLNPTFGLSVTGISLSAGFEIAKWVLVDHTNPSSIFLEWNWAG